MKLSNFTYDLPKELLAEYPSDQRDESRLMVLHRDSNKIEHKLFKDVIDYFNDGDSLSETTPSNWDDWVPPFGAE